MLRGYRLLVIALGLVLCGAKPPQEQPKGQASAQPTEQATANPYAPYAGYNPDPCYQAKDHDTADLCAQWRAALAAEKAAKEAGRATDWSIFATLLSAVSLSAVAFALYLTVEANRIARDTAKRQLRAYMEVFETKIGIFPEDGEIIIQLTFQNCGQTPAYKLRLMSEGFAAPYPLVEERDFLPVNHHDWSASVGPGLTYSCVRRLFADDVSAFIEEAKARRMCPYIQGVCEYEDGFGVTHETRFRYAFAGIVSENGLMMQPARTGNHST